MRPFYFSPQVSLSSSYALTLSIIICLLFSLFPFRLQLFSAYSHGCISVLYLYVKHSEADCGSWEQLPQPRTFSGGSLFFIDQIPKSLLLEGGGSLIIFPQELHFSAALGVHVKFSLCFFSVSTYECVFKSILCPFLSTTI